MTPVSLPDFPWDSLAADRALAEAHTGGIVDLSVGTPVDPVPDVVRAALCGPAADHPGYPTTHGPAELREAVAGALARRFGVTVDPTAVLPTIGSKELVAWLPTLLGLGPGDTVVIPELAYPTYEVGALLARADFVRTDSTSALGPRRVALVWLNSPSNPTGRVLPPEHLRKVVAWARERGAVLASDECYLSLSGPASSTDAPRALSVLHPLGLSQYGPEQVNFLRYRPVLDNRRLKEVFGYVPRLTSAEVFDLFRKARGLGPP